MFNDFNLPAMDWSHSHPIPAKTGGMLEDNFCELVGYHFFEQLTTGPIHGDGNTLDLLLCNTPDLIKTVSISSPQEFGFPTDHYVIEFQIQENCHRTNPIKRVVFYQHRGNFYYRRLSLPNDAFVSTG